MCLKCEWCGTVDFNPIETEDRETGWRSVTCRRCGSDLVEAERCVECNDYFSEEIGDDFFHTAQGEGYCITCLNTLCNIETALKYLSNFDKLDEFVEMQLLDGNDLPFARKALLSIVEQSPNDKALEEEMWLFIKEDIKHFADYMYGARKGAKK